MPEPRIEKVTDFLSRNSTIFTVPIYQRPYVWTADNVRQFLDDIIEHGRQCMKKSNGTYFIGTVVTQEYPDESDPSIDKFDLVDGQQRITTLLLLLAECYLQLKDDEEESKAELMRYLRMGGRPGGRLRIDRLADQNTLEAIVGRTTKTLTENAKNSAM